MFARNITFFHCAVFENWWLTQRDIKHALKICTWNNRTIRFSSHSNFLLVYVLVNSANITHPKLMRLRLASSIFCTSSYSNFLSKGFSIVNLWRINTYEYIYIYINRQNPIFRSNSYHFSYTSIVKCWVYTFL